MKFVKRDKMWGNPFSGLEFFIISEIPDDSEHILLFGLCGTKHHKMKSPDPSDSIAFSKDICQQIMNSLWELGFRSYEGENE